METALPRSTAYAADCGASAAPVRADVACLGVGASKMAGSWDGNPANGGTTSAAAAVLDAIPGSGRSPAGQGGGRAALFAAGASAPGAFAPGAFAARAFAVLRLSVWLVPWAAGGVAFSLCSAIAPVMSPRLPRRRFGPS